MRGEPSDRGRDVLFLVGAMLVIIGRRVHGIFHILRAVVGLPASA